MTAIRITGLTSGVSVVDDAELVELAAGADVVRIADLLRRADVPDAATHCTAISDGGAYRASIPLPDIRSGGEPHCRTMPAARTG